MIGVDGATPREIAFPVEPVGPSLKIHPDGRRVAYNSGPITEAYELWTLDNFLPAPARR